MLHDIPDMPDVDMPMLGALERLLLLLAGEEQTAELFEALGVGIVPVVLDANVIFQDIARYLRTKKPTGILLAARFGFVRFFCSTEVRDEVLEHLRERTRRHATSDEAMQAWEKHYAPLISILDLSGIEVLSTKAVRVQRNDPDDLPTAILIDTIRPQAVLSEDHHLSPYGPAGKDWTQLAVAYRDTSLGQATFVSFYLGGGFTVVMSIATIKALIALILKVDGRILLGIGLGLLAAGGVAAAHPTSRKWLNERLHAAGTWASEHLAEWVPELLDALVELHQQVNEASQFLEEHAVAYEPPRLAHDYMMEVLARTHTDLTAREISTRMQHLGCEPRGEHPERYIAKLLRENPNLFERHSSRRWRFRQG